MLVDKDNPNLGSGEVRVKISWCPFTFFRLKKFKSQTLIGRGVKAYNERWPVLKRTHGIMILRKGRQIDVVQPPVGSGIQSWTNNHRYVRVEIDFDPILDKEFQVTTSKQQIVLSDRMWGVLEKEGLRQAITLGIAAGDKVNKELKAYNSNNAHLTGEDENTRLRPSEIAMIDLAKKSKAPPEEARIREQIKGQENIVNEVQKVKDQLGLSNEEVQAFVQKRIAFYEKKERDVKLVSNGADSPFFDVESTGMKSRKLNINKDHRFCDQIYLADSTSPEVRWNIECLLFTFGLLETDSESEERQEFLRKIRREWSSDLDTTLGKISNFYDSDSERELEETEHLADYKEEDNS